jgi:hypothetical protein
MRERDYCIYTVIIFGRRLQSKFENIFHVILNVKKIFLNLVMTNRQGVVTIDTKLRISARIPNELGSQKRNASRSLITLTRV